MATSPSCSGAVGPRGVGTVMARYGSDVPWWRVIRSGGYFPQGLEAEALAHYREEGTPWCAARSTGDGSTWRGPGGWRAKPPVPPPLS